jgi:hypothetical protein
VVHVTACVVAGAASAWTAVPSANAPIKPAGTTMYVAM